MFLTNDQMTYINDLMDVPFDTFKRQVTIVSTGTKVIVSTDLAFNSSYRDKNREIVQETTQQVFDAIIDYSAKITDQLLKADPNINVREQSGVVRISVKADAATLIKNSSDIQLDGHSYDVITGDIPRAMFNSPIVYYDFWLTRRN